MGQLQSQLFRLSSNDVVKGVVTAVIAAAIVPLAAIATQPGFDISTVDWHMLLHTETNVVIAAFVAYMMKNFLTDQSGKFLGRV